MEKTLTEIRDEHDGLLSDKYTNYLPVYERYFGKFRETGCNLLEIGIQNGGGLQIYDKYFAGKAAIFGVDINEECRGITNYNPEFTIDIGDQWDTNFWNHYKNTRPKMDIIIDDASHLPEQQIRTMRTLLDHVNDGGYYICEDLQGSYGGVGSFIEEAKSMVDRLNEIYCEQRLYFFNENKFTSLHFYQSMIVIEVGKPQRLERVVAGKEVLVHDLKHVRDAPPGSDTRFI
jgi:hypothetical protein